MEAYGRRARSCGRNCITSRFCSFGVARHRHMSLCSHFSHTPRRYRYSRIGPARNRKAVGNSASRIPSPLVSESVAKSDISSLDAMWSAYQCVLSNRFENPQRSRRNVGSYLILKNNETPPRPVSPSTPKHPPFSESRIFHTFSPMRKRQYFLYFLCKHERQQCVHIVCEVAGHRSRQAGYQSVEQLEIAEVDLIWNREL